MTLKTGSIILLSSVALLFTSFDVPADWVKAGTKPKSYEMGIDPGYGKDGKRTATIQSIETGIDGFGTLMQQCKPDKFLGKRVRMSGEIKSLNVKEWSGLWFRVDQAVSRESLSFDNMGDRPIQGTTDWKKYEIVLDVPSDASLIAYGALLTGTGQIWFRNLQFEIVDNTVNLTGSSSTHRIWLLNEPSNLGFEK